MDPMNVLMFLAGCMTGITAFWVLGMAVGLFSPGREVLDFARRILHGDDEHRAWLLEAARAYVEGERLPPPRGKGTQAQVPLPSKALDTP